MPTSVWNVHVCCISDWLVWRTLTELILFVPYIVTIIIHVHQQVHTVYIKSLTIHTHLSLEHEVEFTCVDDLRFYMNWAFFSAFAKLRNATVTFIMSVCPSVCVPVRSYGTTGLPTRRIFTKFDVWVFFFSKMCRKNSSFIKTWEE